MSREEVIELKRPLEASPKDNSMGHVSQPTWLHEKSVSLVTLSMKNHHVPWPTPPSSQPIVEIARGCHACREQGVIHGQVTHCHMHVLIMPGQDLEKKMACAITCKDNFNTRISRRRLSFQFSSHFSLSCWLALFPCLGQSLFRK